MTDEVGTPLPPPVETPKKNSNTVWIIVIVVLVLLCCCCVAFGVFTYNYLGDWLLKTLGY